MPSQPHAPPVSTGDIHDIRVPGKACLVYRLDAVGDYAATWYLRIQVLMNGLGKLSDALPGICSPRSPVHQHIGVILPVVLPAKPQTRPVNADAKRAGRGRKYWPVNVPFVGHGLDLVQYNHLSESIINPPFPPQPE
jgi:hypothetical protein